MKGEINPKAIWDIADMIVESRKTDEEGIVAIKKRVNRKVKNGSD